MGFSAVYDVTLTGREVTISVASEEAAVIFMSSYSSVVPDYQITQKNDVFNITFSLVNAEDVEKFLVFLNADGDLISNVNDLIEAASRFIASAPPMPDFTYRFVSDAHQVTLYSAIPGIFNIRRGTNQWLVTGADIRFPEDGSSFMANIQDKRAQESMTSFVSSKFAFIEHAAVLLTQIKNIAATAAGVHVPVVAAYIPATVVRPVKESFLNLANLAKWKIIEDHAGWSTGVMTTTLQDITETYENNKWFCPLSSEIMSDPRLLPSGRTVDFASLEGLTKLIDPFDATKALPDDLKTLPENRDVKTAIATELEAVFSKLEAAVSPSLKKKM